MKAMMLGGVAAIFGGGIYASGVFEGGEVYDQPVAQVYATLAYMPMPPELKALVKDVPGGEVRVDRIPNQSVAWRFTQEGHEMGVFRATLSPSGETRTRVTVAFEAGDDVPETEKQLVSLPVVGKVAEITMTEQIDSQLEKRPFDRVKIGLAIASYALSNSDEVMSSIGKMDEARVEMEAEVNQMFEQTRDDSAVRKAEPMTDLSKYNE